MGRRERGESPADSRETRPYDHRMNSDRQRMVEREERGGRGGYYGAGENGRHRDGYGPDRNGYDRDRNGRDTKWERSDDRDMGFRGPPVG